jgi:hypothetical protein
MSVPSRWSRQMRHRVQGTENAGVAPGKTCFDMQQPQAACRIGDVNARHSSFSINFCEAFAPTDFAIAYIVWI